jgi:hypothetical protein
MVRVCVLFGLDLVLPRKLLSGNIQDLVGRNISSALQNVEYFQPSYANRMPSVYLCGCLNQYL